MYEKTKFLVAGCTRPPDADLQNFYQTAKKRCPDADLPNDFYVRWIGGDADSTANILKHIRSGDKTGTVSLPDVVRATGQTESEIGDAVILINFDGTPAVVVRIVKIDIVAYGDIDEQHTALDGPRVRDIDIWKPLHLRYFNMLLGQHGLACDDATLVSFESFELVYST